MNDNPSTNSLYYQYPRDKGAKFSVRCIKEVPYVAPVVETTTCYDPVTSVAIPAVQTLGTSTLSSNTYGYYPLTNLTNSGSTVYPTATQSGATQITGKFDGAYNLSGLNSNINLGWSSTLLQTSGKKTFSLWLKPDGKKGVVFSKYKTDTSEGGYILYIDENNKVHAGIKSNNWSGSTQGPVYSTPFSDPLPVNQWTHVAITIDTSTSNHFIKLYINGDLVGENNNLAGTFTNAEAPFLIGAAWYGGNTHSYVSADQPAQTNSTICTWTGCFYKGGVDDFFVVDKVLTDCEIKKLARGITTDCLLTLCSTNQLTASCTATSNNNFVATSTVTWTATTTGAMGPLTYSWVGNNASNTSPWTSGNVTSVEKTYSVPGGYFATSTVSDGVSTTSVACSGSVSGGSGGITITPPASLVVYCYPDKTSVATGTPVTWTAVASGGTPQYVWYYWDGDGLGGAATTSVIHKTYNQVGDGDKEARVSE